MEGKQGSVIGPTIMIRGRVVARAQPLRVAGRIEGVIDHDALLRVETGGSLDATLLCRELEVAGNVSGALFAMERASIADTGTVSGRVVAPLFSVAEGARLDGSVEMDADADLLVDGFQAASESVTAAGSAAKAQREPTGATEQSVPRDAASDAKAGSTEE